MRKGVVVLVPFPFTDLTGQKVRPALVLYASKRGEDCIVAFISSAPRAARAPFDLALAQSKASGLKAPSLLKLEKLATLQKKLILGEIGQLDTTTLRLIGVKLARLFGL